MRLESIKQYWQEACELTADLPYGEFSTPEVVQYVNKYLPSGYEPMTKTKVNYLRAQEILRPQGDGDIRTSWRYSGEDVRRALVVELLKSRAHLGVKEIKGWLKSFEEAKAQEVLTGQKDNTDVPELRGLPDRISLAHTLLRNRVLGMLITALSNGKADIAPPGCFIAIRILACDNSLSPSNKVLVWEEVEQQLKEYPFLAFSEPHSNKLYLHPNLGHLTKYRLDFDEDLAEYIWYNVILQGTDDQLYEVVIGLKDTDSPENKAIDKTLTQHMEEEKGSPIQLSSFPGLSTLLKAAFVIRHYADEATTLSAMAEIIANTSEAWDYCAVFIPGRPVDGMENRLYVQERSSNSPSHLKDRYVEVGKFLPGWCYRYHKAFVVDRAIENDPRIPFSDEGSQTVAAAAVPALTEEQESIGVVYVAKSGHVGEEGVGFSQEELAGLKAFGYICGDIIARDHIEIETVRSLSHLSSHPDSSPIPFPTLKDLLRRVIDEVQKEISPVNALHSWIYLLTLNLDIPTHDLLTNWLCQQAIDVAGNFLAHHLRNSLQQSLFPIGQCKVEANQYVFAVLHAIDLPEERYKQASMDLQQELSRMHIGRQATHFYSWALTFRCKDLTSQLSRKESLLDDMVDSTLGALTAGPYIKRGHDALYELDLDQAVSQFEDARRVLRNGPNSWYVYKHLAEARMLQGAEKIDQAIAMSYKALKLKPDYAAAHCLLADCLAYKGEFGEALKEYERTLQLDNTRRRFLTRYGLTLASMSVSEYQKAVEQLKVQEPELARQRDFYDTPWEEAIDKFDQVQKLSVMYSDNDTPEEQRKHRADYHYQRGYAYLQAGQLDKAVEDFERGRKLAPENMQLLQAYSFALSLRRRQGNKAYQAESAIPD